VLNNAQTHAHTYPWKERERERERGRERERERERERAHRDAGLLSLSLDGPHLGKHVCTLLAQQLPGVNRLCVCVCVCVCVCHVNSAHLVDLLLFALEPFLQCCNLCIPGLDLTSD
jgi:hypothetical protein